jgi:acetyl esterase
VPINPLYAERFGWIPDLPLLEMMQDAELSDRVRASFTAGTSYMPPTVTIRDLNIDGPLGPGSLPIRVYSPLEPSEEDHIFVWVHGGGWVAGTLDEAENDWVARELVSRSGITVVTPDYALANGSTVTYPTLHGEVLTAFQWTVEHAEELGGNPEKVILGGASAGANLSAGAALEARDIGKQQPAALILAYPALHRSELVQTRDAAPLDEVPPVLRLQQPTLSMLFGAYLGASADNAPYASIEGQDLAGLPPALVLIDEYDDLRESAEVFVEEVRAAGGTATRYLAEGMAHGHLALAPTVEETDRSLALIANFITKHPGSN